MSLLDGFAHTCYQAENGEGKSYDDTIYVKWLLLFYSADDKEQLRKLVFAEQNALPQNWLSDWLKMPVVVSAYVVAVGFPADDPLLSFAVRHSAFTGIAKRQCAIILNEIETAEYADADQAAAGISVE